MSEFDPGDAVREVQHIAERIADEVKKEVSNILGVLHSTGIESRANAGMRELAVPESEDYSRAGNDIPAYRPQMETEGPWPFPHRPDGFLDSDTMPGPSETRSSEQPNSEENDPAKPAGDETDRTDDPGRRGGPPESVDPKDSVSAEEEISNRPTVLLGGGEGAYETQPMPTEWRDPEEDIPTEPGISNRPTVLLGGGEGAYETQPMPTESLDPKAQVSAEPPGLMVETSDVYGVRIPAEERTSRMDSYAGPETQRLVDFSGLTPDRIVEREPIDGYGFGSGSAQGVRVGEALADLYRDAPSSSVSIGQTRAAAVDLNARGLSQDDAITAWKTFYAEALGGYGHSCRYADGSVVIAAASPGFNDVIVVDPRGVSAPGRTTENDTSGRTLGTVSPRLPGPDGLRDDSILQVRVGCRIGELLHGGGRPATPMGEQR